MPTKITQYPFYTKPLKLHYETSVRPSIPNPSPIDLLGIEGMTFDELNEPTRLYWSPNVKLGLDLNKSSHVSAQPYTATEVVTIPEKPSQNHKEQTAQQNVSKKPKTVSELWREITGLNWSEAKKLGFTDGSYSKNIQVMRDLKSGKITKSSINSMREALAQSASIPESERIVITPERVGRELSFEDVPSPIDAGAEHDEFLFTPEEREKIGELYNSFDRMSDREWQRNERYADRMDRRDARRSARQARRDQTIRNFDPYAEGYTIQDVISPYL